MCNIWLFSCRTPALLSLPDVHFWREMSIAVWHFTKNAQGFGDTSIPLRDNKPVLHPPKIIYIFNTIRNIINTYILYIITKIIRAIFTTRKQKQKHKLNIKLFQGVFFSNHWCLNYKEYFSSVCLLCKSHTYQHLFVCVWYVLSIDWKLVAF